MTIEHRLFAASLTLAVCALLWFGGEWLLTPVTWRVAALSSVGGGFLWVREWKQKRR